MARPRRFRPAQPATGEPATDAAACPADRYRGRHDQGGRRSSIRARTNPAQTQRPREKNRFTWQTGDPTSRLPADPVVWHYALL